jgi:uncharacterized protein YndB with AHSA1/START domain
MNHVTIVRSLDAPVERVWQILGSPGVSPGSGVDVDVEQPGAPDGSGLTRVVKVGPALAHEEIIQIGPGHVLRYRMTKGAPVKDYVGSVALDESPGGGTRVTWDAEFRPVVPGTGWLISRMTKRTLNRVLDAVAASSRS